MINVKDQIKEMKCIKIQPFFARAKVTAQSYEKTVANDIKLGEVSAASAIIHANVKASVEWYAKLFGNLHKAAEAKDQVAFDQFMEQFGSLLNKNYVTFGNPGKIKDYVAGLLLIQGAVGVLRRESPVTTKVSDDPLGLDDDEVSPVVDQVTADDFKEHQEPEEEEEESDSSAREAMSPIFADDDEITEEAADPMSTIGRVAEITDSTIAPRLSREDEIKALLETPNTAERRNPKPGTVVSAATRIRPRVR